MFVMQCKITEPHESHLFVKRWRKIQLPFLKNPDRYPDSWNAAYQCPGISDAHENETNAINAQFNSRINHHINIARMTEEMLKIGVPWGLPFSGDELARTKHENVIHSK